MTDWPFGNLEPGAYGVVLADPPWQFRTWGPKGNGRSCPYPTMDAKAIRELPVRALAAKNCFLVMWTTAPFLALSLDVMIAWGFRYSTAGAWCKTAADGSYAIGTGYHWRSSAEFWIAGSVGHPPRTRGHAIPNAILSPRREHSRKPTRLHDDLDAMFPGIEKCELFARSQRQGWSCWGNEVSKFDASEVAAQ